MSDFYFLDKVEYKPDIILRLNCLNIASKCIAHPIKDGEIITLSDSFYNWILNKEPTDES